MHPIDTNYILEPADVGALLPPRPREAHKGNFGRVAIVAGQEGMAGAAVLCARAALRSGAGLVYAVSCEANRIILQSSVPEAIYKDLARRDASVWRTFDVIALGPGLGTGEETRCLLKEILNYAACPLVIDADGLNTLAQDRTLMEFLPFARTVLTPHTGEFELLCGGACQSREERLQKQREFSNRYGVIVVLKGADTSISLPVGGGTQAQKETPLLFNPTGNPGMATAGSGDVLTGIIAGLLGQGLTPYQAAYAGVYLHGLAGDLAAAQLGQRSLIAGDLIDYLPKAFLKIL